MKLFMWALIEINTVLFIAITVTFYFLYKQKKQQNEEKDDLPPEKENLSQEDTPQQQNGLDRLVAEQLTHAAKQLMNAKNRGDEKRVTLTKLWGTLLNTERKILKEEKTEPVLKRFLGPILTAIFDSKSNETTLIDLEAKLDKVIQETNESNTTLEVKEELEKVQDSLRQTLQDEISHLEKDAAKLRVKFKEKSKLDANLDKANKNLERLKKQLQEINNGEISEELMNEALFSLEAAKSAAPSQHNAVKQIKKLTKLYERQKNVIELLKGKMDSGQADTGENGDDSGDIGISRLERLVQESDTLIVQLESELANAEQKNVELKSNIVNKSVELKEVTEQLSANKKSALGSLKENTQNNQMMIADLKSTLEQSEASPEITEFIQQQADELSTIERLLKESETCVELLEQELETAKKNNADLSQTIEDAEAQIVPASPENESIYEKCQKQRDVLMSEHMQIKEQLLSSVADESESELRSEYNKKNLEFDRLQLAFIDLEKKHIKLLSKSSSGDKEEK